MLRRPMRLPDQTATVDGKGRTEREHGGFLCVSVCVYDGVCSQLFLTPLPISLSRVCVEEAALNVWISKVR